MECEKPSREGAVADENGAGARHRVSDGGYMVLGGSQLCIGGGV